MMKSTSMELLTRNEESSNPKCPGIPEKKMRDETATKTAKNHEESFISLLGTSKLSSNGSRLLEPHPLDSQHLSGTISSEDNLSALTQCSPHCTTFQLLKRTLDAWDLLRYPWEDQNLQRRSKRAANGPALGTPPSKRLNSLFLTRSKNLGSMENTLRDISLPKSCLCIDGSSSMTSPSATKLVVARTLCSQTPTVSPDFSQPSSCPTESNPTTQSLDPNVHLEKQTLSRKSVIASTQSSAAGTHLMIVVSDMPANNVNEWVMGRNLAMSKKVPAHEFRPKYLRYNLWDSGEHFLHSSADWSETASPLPAIPKSELMNPVVAKTINDNPHLFDIVTPIFVDQFEKLLESHPNQPFVISVCCGLCEGFWPWADTHIGEYPDTLDYSLPDPDNHDEAEFLRNQRDHEVFQGHFSESFGNKLLPGMYCMPIFAVPKPHSADLRMVTHQSAGKYSLNSMIRREDIVGYLLDNLQHLGEFLLSMHHRTPDSLHILYKSDVSEAYRLLPVHPFWQVKQINRISGSLHVDRNNAFGGRASGCNWIAFMSLVSWIAKKQRNIELLGTYSDDSFGPDYTNNLAWYAPYNKFMPRNQVKLLKLWDKINLPHKESKQIYGSMLTIIGIDVDANALSMTMPPEALKELISAIRNFSSSKHKFTLREWQRLAGWINWSFNVFPLL